MKIWAVLTPGPGGKESSPALPHKLLRLPGPGEGVRQGAVSCQLPHSPHPEEVQPRLGHVQGSAWG